MHDVFITGGTGYLGRALAPRLLERRHRVRLLVRPGSEWKASPGCDVVSGDPFSVDGIVGRIATADTFVQLVGVPHPSPSKARQFVDVDLRSAIASIEAATRAGVGHFVYVSVAQPAPVMKAYQEARAEAERVLVASGLRHTIVRPWYVLGPGHRWPLLLAPMYWVWEQVGATRHTAKRLGLVTLAQVVHTLVAAVESPPMRSRIIEVPQILQGLGAAAAD
ncbi:MAG: NAD(P)H-binding protein [Gemmatimonadetes bacterium]|nr:NAD(P)H-binding protein [Gemmatimonadota bacterium]